MQLEMLRLFFCFFCCFLGKVLKSRINTGFFGSLSKKITFGWQPEEKDKKAVILPAEADNSFLLI